MHLDINWTTVVSSGVVAMVIGIFQVIGSRYTVRILEKIERKLGILKENDKEAKK